VIVISARGDERDKVRALDLGADDYLTKPLRRRAAGAGACRPAPGGGTAEAALVVRCGGVVVDLGARVVTRSGAEVRLSPTEYVLLAELARHPGDVMDHRTLLTRVWGPMYAGDRNYLRTSSSVFAASSSSTRPNRTSSSPPQEGIPLGPPAELGGRRSGAVRQRPDRPGLRGR